MLKRLINEFWNPQFFRFVLVGILNTAFGYLMYALGLLLGMSYPLASFVGILLGIAFNFKTIGVLVFESKDNRLILRFALVYLVIYLIFIIVVRIGVLYGLNPHLGGLLATPLSAGVSFLMHKYFVFVERGLPSRSHRRSNWLALASGAIAALLYVPFAALLALLADTDLPVYSAHAEATSLSTYGRWFLSAPYTFATDAFSGDFAIVYNYISDYALNAFAFLSDTPPMMLQVLLYGPLLCFGFIVLNYYFIAKVVSQRRVALLASCMMAFVGVSGSLAFFNPENYQLLYNLFHVPFRALYLGTAQSLGWLLFMPTLCSMYLAYHSQGLKWKVVYGVFFGLLLQAHSLTFINVLFIGLFFLYSMNVVRQGKYRQRLLNTITVFAVIAYIMLLFKMDFRLGLKYIGAGALFLYALNFLFDPKKRFYLISYSVALVVALPYFLNLGKHASQLEGVYNNPVLAFIPLWVLLLIMLPSLFLAIAGAKALRQLRETKGRIYHWLLALLIPTGLLAYNHVFGWGNHPYRFAIHLIFPVSLLAAYGMVWGLQRSDSIVWRISCVLATLWLGLQVGYTSIEAAAGKNMLGAARVGTVDQGKLLQAVKQETSAGSYLLLEPEYKYPEISNLNSLLLNYSKARSYLPDKRYVINRAEFANRLRQFCFLLPGMPERFGHKAFEECSGVHPGRFGGVYDVHVRLLNSRLKNGLPRALGITHAASLDSNYTTIVRENGIRNGWKPVANTRAGTIWRITPAHLSGVASLEKCAYDTTGLTCKLSIANMGRHTIVAAGADLTSISEIQIGSSRGSVRIRQAGLMVAEIESPDEESSLRIEWPGTSEPAHKIYFLAVVGQDYLAEYFEEVRP